MNDDDRWYHYVAAFAVAALVGMMLGAGMMTP